MHKDLQTIRKAVIHIKKYPIQLWKFKLLLFSFSIMLHYLRFSFIIFFHHWSMHDKHTSFQLFLPTNITFLLYTSQVMWMNIYDEKDFCFYIFSMKIKTKHFLLNYLFLFDSTQINRILFISFFLFGVKIVHTHTQKIIKLGQ